MTSFDVRDKRLIFIHHLNPIFLAFKHEDEKLSRTIPYFYIL